MGGASAQLGGCNFRLLQVIRGWNGARVTQLIPIQQFLRIWASVLWIIMGTRTTHMSSSPGFAFKSSALDIAL
jgi:hypothetical protein